MALLAVALVGCGGEASGDRGDGDKAVAASAAGAAEKATPSEPEPQAELELVDDEESADAAEPVVVKVLDNDTIVPASGGKARAVEAELEAEEFALSVDVRPAHGSVKLDGTSIVYTSTAGYGGEDEFTYRLDVKGVKGAKDATPKLSDTAVVRITVTRPAPKVTPKATQTPKRTTPTKATKPKRVAPPPVYYENCDAARAAGAAPVRSGDPGYGRHLDRDGDGVGCEPYNGSSGGGGSTASGGSGSGGSSGSGGGGGGGSASYANCAAVRAAGAAPIRVGDPGYGRHLDRDGDGVACE
ncbi:excalibur calcium-binding domain-containing protein [Streptomyces flavidovirens]